MEAITVLKLRAKESKNKLVCNLVFEEMSIRKRIEWNGTKFTGYVDIGGNVDSDELPEGREALVLW